MSSSFFFIVAFGYFSHSTEQTSENKQNKLEHELKMILYNLMYFLHFDTTYATGSGSYVFY